MEFILDTTFGETFLEKVSETSGKSFLNILESGTIFSRSLTANMSTLCSGGSCSMMLCSTAPRRAKVFLELSGK